MTAHMSQIAGATTNISTLRRFYERNEESPGLFVQFPLKYRNGLRHHAIQKLERIAADAAAEAAEEPLLWVDIKRR